MTSDFKRLMEVDKPIAATMDNMDLMRQRYAEAGGGPDNLRYGWVRRA
jgi:hypothetical protein